MAFDWKYYLVLAKKMQKFALTLTDQDYKEACHRSSVSRAYYATYKLTSKYATDNLNYVEMTGKYASDNHHELVEHLKLHADKKYRKIGHLLSRLKRERNACDYSHSLVRSEDKMNNALKKADNILTTLGL